MQTHSPLTQFPRLLHVVAVLGSVHLFNGSSSPSTTSAETEGVLLFLLQRELFIVLKLRFSSDFQSANESVLQQFSTGFKPDYILVN